MCYFLKRALANTLWMVCTVSTYIYCVYKWLTETVDYKKPWPYIMVWEFSKHFYTTNSPKWGTSMNIIEHEELHYLHHTDNMHAWRECGQLFSAKLMEGMRAAILCQSSSLNVLHWYEMYVIPKPSKSTTQVLYYHILTLDDETEPTPELLCVGKRRGQSLVRLIKYCMS